MHNIRYHVLLRHPRGGAWEVRARLLLGTVGLCLLIAFSLNGEPTFAQKNGPKQPPAKPKGSAAKGSDLFAKNCSACHGANAQGGEGPNLHRLKLTNEAITKTIKSGVKSEMPAFGRRFTDADLKALVSFLRSLK
jgi:mono/diheme cytochrome c family protein